VLGRRVAVLAGLLVLGSCAPSARTQGPYVAKAVTAAEAVHDSTGTDLLLLDAVERGDTMAAYLSTATSQAEDSARSAAGSFASIQPPTVATQQLREELGDLLERAVAVVGEVRVAGRRGDRTALSQLRGRLEAVDRELRAFGEAHR
jgi:hypothetical protein